MKQQTPSQFVKTMQQTKDLMRAEYAAMKPSRFRRDRGASAVGTGSDYHFGSEAQYIKMIEHVRAMDRDDMYFGRIVDCAVEQTVQEGFTFDPDTGDTEADQYIWGKWNYWATNPELCDISGENDYATITSIAYRSEIVDGDVIASLLKEGQLEMFEADRCRTPAGAPKNVVLGVELSPVRKRLAYYLTTEAIGARNRVSASKTARTSVRDEDGERYLFHLYDPTRFSQTRGITAFHAQLDAAGQFEDVNFALILKQQMAACFGAFLENSTSGDFGPDDTKVGDVTTQQSLGGNDEQIEAFTPGIFIRGKPGQKLTTHSPNIPSSETMAHLRFILQMLSVNLGLPLAMVLLDPKDSGSFSAWRGIFDQAKLGFKFNQSRLISRFHRPIFTAKIRQWISSDPKMEAIYRKVGDRIFNVKIQGPRWSYVQPVQDIQAKAMRVNNLISSLRRETADEGNDFDDIYKEIVDDNFAAIGYAIEKTKELAASHTDVPELNLSWRDLLPRDMPSGLKAMDQIEASKPEPPEQSSDSSSD